MKLGCSTILYGGYDLDTALDGIKRAGYEAIELCSIQGMAEHLPVDQSPQYYQDVVGRISERGLAIESIGASTNLLDQECRRRFIKLMHIAKDIGAPALTTGSGGTSDDEESFKTVVNTINELARIGAELGVKLSIKPHVRSAVYSTKTALRFMREVDTNWVGLNYDASHLWRTPEKEMPEESLKQLAPYIFTARIRDTLSRDIPIGSVENQIPGRGAMNLSAICEGLKGVQGLEYVTLEIVGTKDFPLEEVQRVVEESKRYLDRYI